MAVWKRIGLVLVAAVGVVVATASPAGAHAGDESYVYLDVSTDQLSGQVEYPFPDVESVFGVELGGSRDANAAAIESILPELLADVESHLSIGVDGEAFTIEYDGYEFLSDEFDVGTDYVLFPFEVDLPGEVPQVFDVTFDPFFDEIDDRRALLLISNDYDRGVFDNELESLVTFSASNRSQTVDLGDASKWTNFTTSVELGLDHIRTGPDHIFFVFVLLLPSVLLYRAAKWWPVERFGSSLWRVLKLVTMFTIAHSITFTLAGLDVLPLPSSKLVETIIALSIAAAALNNVWPVAPNREWLIAGSFGLFHGMGFASLVSDLQIDRTTQLVSLLGRNVGIEIGQAVVVLVAFPMLFLLRRTIYYRPLFGAASLVMALVSIGWMFERIFEEDLGYNELIDRVVQWPRSLAVMAVLTVIAAGVYWFEASRDRLRPFFGDDVEAGTTGDGDDSDDTSPDEDAVLV